MSGKHYGRYILEHRIAMGGMAEIFAARTRTEGFEKRVCIKRILPHYLESEEFVTMFRDEARTAARLQHANVVQVFDFGEVEGTLFLAMELVDGSDLRRVLEAARKRQQPLAVGSALQIAIDMCKGLHHAHTLSEGGRPLGIVHRDVSPHNVLVSKAGEVKVTDFGIARAAERATHTGTGLVKGKIAYMAPEQAQGLPFDHRLDQFATGVVLWEMLTGQRLFAADNDASALKKVLACQVPLPSSLRREVPSALDEVVARALRESPAERFADMRQLEMALQRVLFSGAVDPSTADVRSMYERVMADATPQVRKTAIIAHDTSEAGPAPSSGMPLIEGLPPPAMTESNSRLAGQAGSSSSPSEPGGSVASVFSSSEKQAPAPGPSRPQAAVVIPVPTEVEPHAPDPNARTTHEDAPGGLAALGAGALDSEELRESPEAVASPPLARTATATPVARRAASTEDEHLPSLSELERAEAAAAPIVEHGGTPATRTAVPTPVALVPPHLARDLPPTLLAVDEPPTLGLPAGRRRLPLVAAGLAVAAAALVAVVVLRPSPEPAETAATAPIAAAANEPSAVPSAVPSASTPPAAEAPAAPATPAPATPAPGAELGDAARARPRARPKTVEVLVRTPRYSGFLLVGNERLEISPQGAIYRLPTGTLAVRVQRGDGPSKAARITVVPGQTTVVSLD